jgi:hypothetical protein
MARFVFLIGGISAINKVHMCLPLIAGLAGLFADVALPV